MDGHGTGPKLDSTRSQMMLLSWPACEVSTPAWHLTMASESSAATLGWPNARTAASETKEEDAELVRLVVERNPRATTLLWKRFAPSVRGVIRRAIWPNGDVEDLVQDVFVLLFRKLREAIDKGLVGSNACRLEAVEPRTKIRFRIKPRLRIQILGEIAHAHWTPGHEADSQLRTGV